MKNLTNIKIHGILAEQLGQSEWKLAARSIGEAVKGIQCNNKKLYKQLLENDKKNIKYRVLINDKDFTVEEGKDPNTVEGFQNSELVMKSDSIKTIDIVPVLEGSDKLMSILTIIIGVVLIATGVGAAGGAAMLMSGGGGMMATAMVLGGVGLVAAGITNLLTPMPEFGDFREIEQGGARSYLFNGPQNTIREGGPVFVGYGRLLVGSHVIQAASDTVDVDAEVAPKLSWGGADALALNYYISRAGDRLDKAVEKWNEKIPGD
ncbi:MAG TPA: tail assembly protein [Nitrospina sp.]|nr:tail assembly protein [Nitrospina sp.]